MNYSRSISIGASKQVPHRPHGSHPVSAQYRER